MCELRHIESKTIFPIIKDILDSRKSVRITITGMSMYPFLRECLDSVELSFASFQTINKGEIVLVLRNNGQYALHRVIKKEEECFYMIGDAQQWIEGPLYSNQLIAVVTAVWRKNKRIEYTNVWWRILSLIWLKIIPFRCFLIRICKALGKISRRRRDFYRRYRT